MVIFNVGMLQLLHGTSLFLRRVERACQSHDIDRLKRLYNHNLDMYFVERSHPSALRLALCYLDRCFYQYPLKFRIFIGNRDFDLTFPNFNSGFSSFFHIALSEVKMT